MRLWKASLFWLAACAAAMGQTVSSSTSVSVSVAGFGLLEADATATYPGPCAGTDGEGSATYGTINVIMPDGTECQSLAQDTPSISCYSELLHSSRWIFHPGLLLRSFQQQRYLHCEWLIRERICDHACLANFSGTL